jgi:hypothetical protein
MEDAMSQMHYEVMVSKQVLTVSELIRQLQEVDQDAIIVRYVEGITIGCTVVSDKVIGASEARIGYRVQGGQKAITIV